MGNKICPYFEHCGARELLVDTQLCEGVSGNYGQCEIYRTNFKGKRSWVVAGIIMKSSGRRTEEIVTRRSLNPLLEGPTALELLT